MKKIFLYISAFVPLYFLVTIKILIDIVFGNLHFNILNTISLILLIFAIIFGFFGAKMAIKHKNFEKQEIFVVSKTSITEQYFLGYFSLFVLFALSFELEKVSMFVVFIIILILIGVVYIKNDLFYINPLLNILGYNFYEVDFKKNDDDKIYTSKFVCKGKLETNKKTKIAKLSHDNFSLIKN